MIVNDILTKRISTDNIFILWHLKFRWLLWLHFTDWVVAIDFKVIGKIEENSLDCSFVNKFSYIYYFLITSIVMLAFF